jgi:hypothetical protein
MEHVAKSAELKSIGWEKPTRTNFFLPLNILVLCGGRESRGKYVNVRGKNLI